MEDNVILRVNHLRTRFGSKTEYIDPVADISFQLKKGEILGIVGESGCGKSMTALSLLRLIQKPGRIEDGEILLDGLDLTKLSEKRMQNEIRGNRISMIFQEPMTSLNPLFTIGQQLMEPLRQHRRLSKEQAQQEAIRMLSFVGIPSPEERFGEYPHELSGGMRQRVMIAMALCCKPEVLVADEPTTALDVTIQAQILDLMRNLRDETGTATILITHDLGVVAHMCDRVLVMYCGKIVEEGTTEQILSNPRHPYTKGLIASVPRIRYTQKRLHTIPGTVPHLDELPQGCRFANRCKSCMERCYREIPDLTGDGGHRVRCFLEQEAYHA